jgi:hypothetical protein
VLCLAALAAGLRAARWARTDALFNDGPLYLALAEAIREGDLGTVLDHAYHPLYPALTALLAPLAGGLEPAALAVSVVSGAGALVALWAFLRGAFGARAAAVGGFLLAVHPRAIEFSADVQSEGCYLAFFLAAMACLWRSLAHARAGAAFGAGAFTGLAYLARPEGLGLAAVGLAVGLGRLAARRLAPVPALRLAGAAALGLALAGGVYPLALHERTGEWLLTRKKTVAHLAGVRSYQGPRVVAELPDAPESASPRAVLLGELPALPEPEAAGERPPGLAAATYHLSRTVSSALRPELLLLLACGLYAARGRPGLRGALVGATVALYGAVLLGLALNVGYVSRRHVLPPFVPAFGYAALGLDWLAAALARAPLPALAGRPRRLAIALLVAVGALGAGKALKPQRGAALAERRAAEWLREQGGAGGPVAAHRRRVAYYAGARYHPLPKRFEAGVVGALRARGVRYLVLDADREESIPGLHEPAALGLRPVHESRAGGRRARVYELVPPPAPPITP